MPQNDDDYSDDNSSTRKRDPLPGSLQKALAEEIEANGGIGTFSGQYNQKLSTILNIQHQSSSVFGRKGDPIRKKLQQKVLAWQKLHEKGLYESQVLLFFKVQSSQSRLIQQQSFDTPKKSSFVNKDNAIHSLGSSSESSTESSISPQKPLKKLGKATNTKNRLSVLKSPPAKHITVDKHQIPPSPLLTPADKHQIRPSPLLTPAISQSLHDKNKTMALPHNASKFQFLSLVLLLIDNRY